MKLGFLLSAALVIWVLIYGAPLAKSDSPRAHYYQSPEPILPMSFAHMDHTSVGCIDCHHNYVDDTGSLSCMNCHVTDQEVWPLFEEQFHDLCRGCHETKSAARETTGPPRHCEGCHVIDYEP